MPGDALLADRAKDRPARVPCAPARAAEASSRTRSPCYMLGRFQKLPQDIYFLKLHARVVTVLAGATKAHASSSRCTYLGSSAGRHRATAMPALSGWPARAAVIREARQPCTLASEAEMSCHKAMHERHDLAGGAPEGVLIQREGRLGQRVRIALRASAAKTACSLSTASSLDDTNGACRRASSPR